MLRFGKYQEVFVLADWKVGDCIESNTLPRDADRAAACQLLQVNSMFKRVCVIREPLSWPMFAVKHRGLRADVVAFPLLFRISVGFHLRRECTGPGACWRRRLPCQPTGHESTRACVTASGPLPPGSLFGFHSVALGHGKAKQLAFDRFLGHCRALHRLTMAHR